MSLTLPYPNVPTNGQALDAAPVLANFLAIAQAIQAFDGSQVVAGTILAAAMAASANPNTLINQTTFPFVASGLIWSGDSYGASLNGSMTSGVIYYNGVPVAIGAVTANAFAASKDTYIDIDLNGNITYQAVTNNAASPALTANSIRVAIVVSGAGSIASVAAINQGQPTKVLPIASSIAYTTTDSLGNLICPRDSGRKTLGYRQIIVSPTTTSTTGADITGLSMAIIVPDNRRIKLILDLGTSISSNAGTGSAVLASLNEGATVLARKQFLQYTNNAGTGIDKPTAVITPSSGLHTYKGQFWGTSAGTVTLNGDPTFAPFIKAELD